MEVVLRLFFPPPPIVDISRPQKTITTKLIRYPEYGTLYIKTERGLRLRPNTVATIYNHPISKRNIVIRTNSLGYRNPELEPKERKRILFLGDSITCADYVDEEETFVRVVQSISEAFSEPLETVNAGVGAIGLENYLNILQETGLSINPDIVIIGFYLNDFKPSLSIKLLHPPQILRSSWFFNYVFYALSVVKASLTGSLQNIIPREEVQSWYEEINQNFALLEPAYDGTDRFKDHVLQKVNSWGGTWSTGAWKRMSETLRTLKATLKSAGVTMVIAAFPVRDQVYEEKLYDFPQRKLKEVAKELQVDVIDLLPTLRKERKQPVTPLFYDHCHYTPYGNSVIAKGIWEFLAKKSKK
ncbi:MAG: GDSL-type esterase/lipase family protein [Candidatus Dadabacteria bacterium]|nr:GDSL-type esterase/lipase family protein [Candidatus Dadabacteria bacterium]